MKILDKYIIKTFFGPFVLTFFISLFILEMQFLWQYFEDMVGKGLETSVLIKLFAYASASLVSMALPLAVLLSSIMTFGNMGEKYELVSMKAAGVSLKRVMRPLVIFVVLLSLGAFQFSNTILPVANLKFKSLLYDIMRQRPALDFKPGIFYKGIDGYVIRISDKAQDGQTLQDVLIYDHTSANSNKNVIKAESGKIFMSDNGKFLIMELFNGYRYEDTEGKRHPMIRNEFEKHTIRFNLAGFDFQRTDEDLFKDHYQMLNFRQLVEAVDSLTGVKQERLNNYFNSVSQRLAVYRDTLPQKADTLKVENAMVAPYDSLDAEEKLSVLVAAANLSRASKTYSHAMKTEVESRKKRIARHKIEQHRKFTLSIACIVLFFIGAPMGAIVRKGGLGLPVIISVVFFLIYHISSMTGEKLVKNIEIEAWEGMWVSTFILTPIGILLTYKATSDSVILDSTYYSKLTDPLFKKVINPLTAKFKKQKPGA